MPKKTVYRTKEKNEKLSVTIEKPLRFHCGIRSIIALKADENLFPFIYYYFYFFFWIAIRNGRGDKKDIYLKLYQTH